MRINVCEINMNTLNSDMSNGHKRLSCLDFVKLRNHTHSYCLKAGCIAFQCRL